METAQRRQLLAMALEGLTKEAATELFQEVQSGVAKKKGPKSFAEQVRGQLEKLVLIGVHGICNKSEGEFRALVEPLVAKAAKLKVPKHSNFSVLLVVPLSMVAAKNNATRGRRLYQTMMLHTTRKIRFEWEERDWKWLNSFKNIPSLPTAPYLLVDVSNGDDVAHVDPEWKDKGYHAGADFGRLWLEEKAKRLPLTFDEFVHVAFWGDGKLLPPAARLVGTTRYGDLDGFADVKVTSTEVLVSDYEISMLYDGGFGVTLESYNVPHARERITA